MKKNKKVLTNRLRDNWFFPFCASAFFYLATPVSYIYDIGVIIAFFIAILIAAYFPPVIDEIKIYRGTNFLDFNSCRDL